MIIIIATDSKTPLKLDRKQAQLEPPIVTFEEQYDANVVKQPKNCNEASHEGCPWPLNQWIFSLEDRITEGKGIINAVSDRNPGSALV